MVVIKDKENIDLSLRVEIPELNAEQPGEHINNVTLWNAARPITK